MQGCHSARTPAQCRSRGTQCKYDESIARCVWDQTEFIDTLALMCDESELAPRERRTILKAVEKDLALYGISYPGEENGSANEAKSCDRLPILMLAHVLLRPFGDHATDIERSLKALGTRASSLPEFLQDIESFVDRLQASVEDSRRWEAYAQALPGLQEAVVRYGPSRTGRMLAAGGIMLLVLLAMGLGSAHSAQTSPHSSEEQIPVMEEEVAEPSANAEDWLKWGATAIGQGALTAAGGQLLLRGIGSKNVLPAQNSFDTTASRTTTRSKGVQVLTRGVRKNS